MICLEKNRIVHGTRDYPIERIECWWFVDGKGLYPNLNEALAVNGTVTPAPVAIAANGIYEPLPPTMEK